MPDDTDNKQKRRLLVEQVLAETSPARVLERQRRGLARFYRSEETAAATSSRDSDKRRRRSWWLVAGAVIVSIGSPLLVVLAGRASAPRVTADTTAHASTASAMGTENVGVSTTATVSVSAVPSASVMASATASATAAPTVRSSAPRGRPTAREADPYDAAVPVPVPAATATPTASAAPADPAIPKDLWH